MHNRLHNQFKTKNGKGRATRRLTAEAEEPRAEVAGGEGLGRRAVHSLASHPAIAIGAAFAFGLLIGKWVKR